MLEKRLHEFSCFVTLTYDDDHFPEGGSLDPSHTQKWLKRLRRRLGPERPLRYFLNGEYGDQTWRPHYHAALYGVSELESALVLDTWGQGHVQLGALTVESAQYISGYVVKKMTARDDPRLEGRHPEFARMSLKPGIGAGAISQLAEALNSSVGSKFIASTGDVPSALTHGTRSFPLGRYLRRFLREEMGFSEVGGQEGVARRQAQELLALCLAEGVGPVMDKKEKERRQKVKQIDGKAAIFKKRNSL